MTVDSNVVPATAVAVFCGSNHGSAPVYGEAARSLGGALARRGLTMVYGGTHLGLMGVTADAALAAGGTVVGIIHRRLHERGHLHGALTRHEIVPDLRSRKARMAELSDTFIALPGGLGTLEELFEAATLTQLGDHVGRAAKPCGALNVAGFFDPMSLMLDRAVDQGFMKAAHRDMIIIDADPDSLLDRLAQWTPPTVSKWIAQPAA